MIAEIGDGINQVICWSMPILCVITIFALTVGAIINKPEMTKPKPKTCSSCKYYFGGSFGGSCRRNPPKVSRTWGILADSEHTDFPKVNVFDTCGEYKKAKKI